MVAPALFANHLSSAPASAPASAPELVCEVRPLETLDDLIAAFRLRHEVYGALGYLQRTNSSGLEIDEYDAFSIPFGAFDPVTGEMIGTLRLITSEIQDSYDDLIHRVLGQYSDPALIEQVLSLPSSVFPSLATRGIERQLAAYNPEGLPVYELSRTIVRPDHRGSGVSRRLMEIGLAYAMRNGPALLIGSCLPEHVAMYARYGYCQLPATGFDRYASVGQVANAVVCRTDVLPEPTRSHVAELLHSMRAGAKAHTLELARDAHVRYRFSTPRRQRRRTMEMEW